MGFFITLLLYGLLFVLSDLLSPKPDIENAKPSGLGDFQFPTATEGRALPLIWGRVKLKGPNIVWYGDLIQTPIKEKIKTGLTSSEIIIKGYQYAVGIQFALCQGVIDDLTRVWNADDLVFDQLGGTPIVGGGAFSIDKPELYGGEDLGNGGLIALCKFFSGTNTQAASTYLSEFQTESTTGDTPAYQDLSYVAPVAEPFYVGNSTSIKAWSFEVRRTPNGLALSGDEIVNDGDANPMNVLYEVLTDTDWGYGIDTGDIDTSNFSTAAALLQDEGNGFSFILDRVEDLGQLVQRIEKQIDGIVYLNPSTAQWQIKLIRDDYVIANVPKLLVSNSKVKIFTRSTWEGTKNQVRVPFNDRIDDYKSTFGFAQDMANVRIVGSNVSTTVSHPGIKDRDLANAIAWRELRTLSTPLAQGTWECDRTFYSVLPGDVLAFTDETLGFTLLPMRVKDIDYGEFLDGKIIINAVQDIFKASAGSFAAPPSTGWGDPHGDVSAFPTAEQLAIEAPRALTHRDPLTTNATADKVYCAARRQGPEAQIVIRESFATPPSTPDTTFIDNGTVNLFTFIGQLSAALPPGSVYPLTSLLLNATPSTQTEIEEEFPDVVDTVELGTELLSLCYINSSTPEFILVSSAQTSATQVQLNNVFRGVLDTPQGDHAISSDVFLLYVGGGLSSNSVLAGDNVDIKLIPKSAGNELADALATTIEIRPMSNRTRRPYPPSEFDLNGTRYDSTLVDLDGSGTGEDVGVLVDDINRRDHRTAEGENEIEALTTDAGSLFTVADFSLTHGLVCLNGSTQLVDEDISTAVTGTIRQLDILQALDATTLPASLTFGVRATHIFETVSYDSLFDTVVTSTLVSDFIGKTAFGARSDSVESEGFTVTAATVDHVFTLSTALSFAVQFRLNLTGGWTTLIAASGTSGTILAASLTTSDIITIRHLDTNTGFQKLITMTVSSVIQAYGVLIP